MKSVESRLSDVSENRLCCSLLQISFTESSMFQTVVSVAHAARVCGHRFRTNAAACHPVLPLLLTTSHHNLPDPDTTPERETSPEEEDGDASKSLGAEVFAFCSELILWQVLNIIYLTFMNNKNFVLLVVSH